jgi:hypothetical protein
VHKEKPTSKARIPATTLTTLKKPHKFSPGPIQNCKHHLQYQFPEWIERYDKCIHRKGKEVMKSNTTPSFEPQTPLTMFISVGHSPTTFDAVITTTVMKTEFSTLIMKSSSQPSITPTITSTKDDISTIPVVPLLIAWQIMHETFTVSSLSNELLQ